MFANAMNVLGRCRVNEFYRRGIETADLLDAIGLRDKAQSALRALLPGIPHPRDPDTADTDLDAWLEAVTQAEGAEKILATSRSALTRVVNNCDRRIESAVALPDPILSRLNDYLAELMVRVGDVVDCLNGARSPAEAIAADVGGAWRGLMPLRGEYDSLRQAQEWCLLGRTTLIDARSRHIDDDHASDAWIKNMDDVWPDWNQPDRTIRLSGDAPRRQPWPSGEAEMLVWLHNSDAEPWIPTVAQLAELHAERHRRLNPPSKPRRLSEFPKQRVYATKSILG